jgi:hypothetical protein
MIVVCCAVSNVIVDLTHAGARLFRSLEILRFIDILSRT